MSRQYASVYVSAWTDPDWLALTQAQQWTFLFLISQPRLNHCGVLDYIPARWADVASDLDAYEIDASVRELAATEPPFLILDEARSELLIRSFIRWDGCLLQPNMAKALANEYRREVSSKSIKAAILVELRRIYAEHPGHAGFWAIGEVNPELEFEIKGFNEERTKGTPKPPAKGGANPRAMGKPKGKANPSGNPSANPSPNP